MKKKMGFTLIEIMIVVAIIAIIAAYTVVSLTRSRITSQETSAINTLRTIHTNQTNFKNAKVVDEDDDGTGEYGFLQELAGTIAPRDPDSAPVQPAQYLSNPLGNVGVDGTGKKQGYYFKIYLPDSNPIVGNGSFASESAGVVPNLTPAGIDGSEEMFICYAWPAAYGHSGFRAFVIDSQGVIYQDTNDENAPLLYNGGASIPEPMAAYLLGPTGDVRLPSEDNNFTGSDGNRWVPVN